MSVPICIQWLSALLTPAIAVAGITIGVLNYLHARRKRKDDLFDRRYEFYKRVRDWWLKTGTGAAPGQDPSVHPEDVIPIADEARLLFGKEVAQHLMSLVGRGHSGSPFFPNGDFTMPFDKYLRFQ
jgi:hypothetical protein